MNYDNILFFSTENDDPVYFSYFLIDPKKGELESTIGPRSEVEPHGFWGV
jgi:hypothetical protein